MSFIAASVATIGAVTSTAGTYFENKAERERADKARDAEIKRTKMAFNTTQAASTLMKNNSVEAAANMSQEALRAGAAESAKTKQGIQKAESSLVAQSEGLTSGRSKGREMISLEVQARKAMNEVQNETTTMVNRIVDVKDKAQNDINNKEIQAWQEMAMVLTTPGAVVSSPSAFQYINSAIGGAKSGASLAGAF